MANNPYENTKLKSILIGMMIVALILSWTAMRGISTIPYSGYRMSSDYRVVQLRSGGPASFAGLKLGDQIIEINGIPTQRLYQLLRQAEPKPGDTIHLKVLRNGAELNIAYQAIPLPTRQATSVWIYQIVALYMLVGGLSLFWAKPRKTTLLFALSSTFIALSLMTPPHLQSLLFRNLVALNSLFFTVLGLAFFLHLTIVFPKPKLSVLETPVEIFIYLPVPLLLAFYLSLGLFQPWVDLRLNQTLNYGFGLCVLYCLGLSLAAVIHSYWISRSTAQPCLGLLVGSLLGILPPAVLVLRNCFLPRLALPGSSLYPLMILFAYFAFTWALLKEEPQVDSDLFQKAA
ncbi:MAG: PDZ domain-containing protein [Terriglobia bacterium]